MARFGVVLAVLFLMAAAWTSAHKTVVTTTLAEEEEEEEENQRGCEQYWSSRHCQMRHCMQWMRSMAGPYEESLVIRSTVANQGRFEEEHLEECCNELREVRPSMCRCAAIRCMMKQMQQEQRTEQEMQQMRQMAQYLPRMCGMSSPTECPMHPIFA